MIHRFMHGFAFAVVLSAMLASASHTDAQNPSKVGDEVAAGSVDRPTQRWIPLPDNDAAGLSAQAQLLQELQELLSGNEPPPKLSEKQLKQMEETFKQLRDELGEDMLPKLEDIPKEWINEALSDPLVRQQAQKLLEQYARDRKMPSREEGTSSSQRIPFPRRSPNDPSAEPNRNDNPQNDRSNQGKPSNPESSPQQSRTGQPSKARSKNQERLKRDADNFSQDAQAANAPAANEPAEEKRSEDTGDSDNSTLPQRPDAERIEALRQLFDKLKGIDENRTNNAPKRNSNATSNGSSTSKEASSSNSAARDNKNTPRSSSTNRPANQRPSTQGASPQRPQPNGSNGQRLTPEQRRQREIDWERKSAILLEQVPESDLQDEKASQSSASGRNPASSIFPGEQASPSESEANESSDTKNSEASSDKASPSSKSAATTPSRKPQSRTSPATKSSASKSAPDQSSTKPQDDLSDADIKTQLEKKGLGGTLRSIIESTVREQGEWNKKQGADPASQTGKQSSGNAGGKNASSDKNKGSSKTNGPSPQAPSSTQTARNPSASQKTPAQNASPSNSTNGNSNSSTFAGLRDLASDVWGAIRTAPDASSSNNASSGASSALPSLPTFQWNASAWLMLFVVIGIAAFVLFWLRREIVLASTKDEEEAKVATELLAEGIRNRADVVRAFHRFVFRGREPVANWWHHRYVARRLSEATPQLGSVIMDLASVYEFARYLPPEMELSPDQLNRVQMALKQCVSSGA